MIKTEPKTDVEFIDIINLALQNKEKLFEDIYDFSQNIYFNEKTLKLTQTVDKDDFGYVLQLNLLGIENVINSYKNNFKKYNSFNKNTKTFTNKEEIIFLLNEFKEIFYQTKFLQTDKRVLSNNFIYDEKMLQKMSIRFLYTFLKNDFHFKVKNYNYIMQFYNIFYKNDFLNIGKISKLMLHDLISGDKANLAALKLKSFSDIFINYYVNITDKKERLDSNKYILRFLKSNDISYLLESENKNSINFWNIFKQYQHLITNLYDKIETFKNASKLINVKNIIIFNLQKDEIYFDLLSDEKNTILLSFNNIIELVNISENYISRYLKTLKVYTKLIYIKRNEYEALNSLRNDLEIFGVKEVQKQNIKLLIETINTLIEEGKIKII